MQTQTSYVFPITPLKMSRPFLKSCTPSTHYPLIFKITPPFRWMQRIASMLLSKTFHLEKTASNQERELLKSQLSDRDIQGIIQKWSHYDFGGEKILLETEYCGGFFVSRALQWKRYLYITSVNHRNPESIPQPSTNHMALRFIFSYIQPFWTVFSLTGYALCDMSKALLPKKLELQHFLHVNVFLCGSSDVQ